METTTPGSGTPEVDSIGTAQSAITNLSAELTRMKKPLDETLQKMYEIVTAADSLNKTFIGNRARIREMMDAVSAVGPEIVGLGGKFDDARKTIEGVALGSRRNVIGNK